MGSATRSALEAARRVLEGLTAPVHQDLGRELLEVSTVLGETPHLVAALADPAASPGAKQTLISQVFGKASDATTRVVEAASFERWSHAGEFVDGIEELGVRAAALAHQDLEHELLAIEKVISQNHELELSLGSKLGDSETKVRVVNTLLAGKVSESALSIATHVVAQPRGRRIGRVLRGFAKIIADQGGADLATVTLAAPLDEARYARLQELLSAQTGRAVKLTTVIDPSLVGGVRIQIGDNVIDGSVKARLDDLRLQLAR